MSAEKKRKNNNNNKTTPKSKKYLRTECAVKLGCSTAVMMTVCTLSMHGFRKELHKFRKQKSTRGYCLGRPRKLWNGL